MRACVVVRFLQSRIQYGRTLFFGYFQPRAETAHVIAKNFSPANRAEFNPGVENAPCNRPLSSPSCYSIVDIKLLKRWWLRDDIKMLEQTCASLSRPCYNLCNPRRVTQGIGFFPEPVPLVRTRGSWFCVSPVSLPFIRKYHLSDPWDGQFVTCNRKLIHDVIGPKQARRVYIQCAVSVLCHFCLEPTLHCVWIMPFT